jgi:hypothetical protein
MTMTNTTRKEFGTALAVLVRVCKAAQARGDAESAELCASAVDLLIDAWPSEHPTDDQAMVIGDECPGAVSWPVAEGSPLLAVEGQN